MAWGWYLKILDKLHVWKISDDAKRSPIFFIHEANPIFLGFTRKKPSNDLHYYVSESDLNKCMKSKHFCLPNDSKFLFQVQYHIVQTTCNSSNPTVQQIELRSLWSQTTLGTMKMKGTTKKGWFWVANTLEPNNTGNHNKWKELLKMFIFE